MFVFWIVLYGPSVVEHCTTVLYLGRFVVGSKDLPKAILCLLVFHSIP